MARSSLLERGTVNRLQRAFKQTSDRPPRRMGSTKPRKAVSPSELLTVIQQADGTKLPGGLAFKPGHTNRLMLEAFQRVNGVQIAWPIDTACVFALLLHFGYRADRRNLDHLLGHRYLARPARLPSQAFAWTEDDFVAYADVLEAMRRWQPANKLHVHKFNEYELDQHNAAVEELKGWAGKYSRMGKGELIDELVTCDNADERRVMALALKCKTGIVKVPDA